MKKVVVKKILISISLLVFVIYIGFQVYNLSYSKVKTEPALLEEIDDSIEVDAFIVRDETAIPGNQNDIIKYVINDGDRVSCKGVIAEIYKDNDDILIKNKIQDIDNEIEKLTNLNYSFESSSTNPEKINQLISQKLTSSILNINDGNYVDLYADRADILYLINEYRFIVGDYCDLSKRIKDLQEKKSELENQCKPSIGTMLSPKAGYFVNSLDDYENAIPYEKALFLTVDDIDKGIFSNKEKDRYYIGKIIENVNWYMIYKVSSNKAMDLNLGKDVTVTFPFARNNKVPCKIEKINQQDRNSDAAVILKCNYMNKEFAKIRNEKIKVNLKSYSGIRVNKSAIHNVNINRTFKDENGIETVENKEVQGVYVLYGGKLVYKQIIPIYSGNDFVLCEKNPDKNLIYTTDTLGLYDKVVVNGVDLYDGKAIR